MSNKTQFDEIFKDSSNAKSIGLKLRHLIFDCFDDIDENISGGKKVKLALYSKDNSSNVLCGIQQSKDDCMLYVHHVNNIDHERLKFSGKGKHAKRIKFQNPDEIKDEDIKWLFEQVKRNAPF